MSMELRKDVSYVVRSLIEDNNPYNNVCEALKKHKFSSGKIYVVAIGKAAYTMALAAKDTIKNVRKGVVISKYGHITKKINGYKCFEAGHPISDNNTIEASKYVLEMTSNLRENDEVILLISGGGSALFESPKVPLATIQDINDQLLKSGAKINEINMIRKHLSNVKGGRFAKHCMPAKVTSIILSDVIGDDLSSIASGPAVPDNSSSEDALRIINRYRINVSDEVRDILKEETVKQLDNIETIVVGSVSKMCECAKKRLEHIGYETYVITDSIQEEARVVGASLGHMARKYKDINKSIAFIIGGETIVRVNGVGKGGRNQELALAACKDISGLDRTCVFAFGSDGTDGPTDAAGGYVDGDSAKEFEKIGVDVDEFLNNNNAYNCLKQINGLIKTGPTGSNVNDIYCLLIRRN